MQAEKILKCQRTYELQQQIQHMSTKCVHVSVEDVTTMADKTDTKIEIYNKECLKRNRRDEVRSLPARLP